MTTPATETKAALYARRVTRFAAEAEARGRQSRLLANLRGASFGVFFIAALFLAFGRTPEAAASIAGIGLAAFVFFVVWHAKVLAAEDEALRWARVNREAQARCEGRWRELPEQGTRFSDPSHPYLDDLDVFGHGSLFQRICVAHTRFGQDALANFFRQPATRELIEQRQAAVQALAPELELRQSLEALALAVVEPPPVRVDEALERAGGIEGKKHRAPPDPEPLLRWAEAEPRLSSQPLVVWPARLLPVLTLAGVAATWLGGVGFPIWVAPLGLQIVLTLLVASETTRVFRAVSATEGAFLRYGAMLGLLEELDIPAPLLQALRDRVHRGQRRPSLAMKDFRAAVGWFDLRHNGLVHPFVNAATCWDIHCVLRLEAWQRSAGRSARDWFVALGELEALSSLAGLAHDAPDHCFPELADEPRYEAEGLGHPLVESASRVTNDVLLPEAGTALLVTGSNMSGKSTLLRAMGLAAVMALAGAPVCARRFRIGELAVHTSIRISDSLEAGVSHFLAELRKLKAVVEATRGDRAVLFLLDEILHGTNSRERQIGARWVFRELLEHGALGAVSTHDMELVELPDSLAGRMQLVHFRESVQDGRMTFDYRLRRGPVTSGNALRLMQLLGLDVPLDLP